MHPANRESEKRFPFLCRLEELLPEVNGGTRDRAQCPGVSSPSGSAVGSSYHCRCQRNPALFLDELQTGLHARFGPTVCMQDSRSLEVLMHMSGLAHPITREAKNRKNSWDSISSQYAYPVPRIYMMPEGVSVPICRSGPFQVLLKTHGNSNK